MCLCVCVCVCVCVLARRGCSINSTARGKRGSMILDGGGGGSRKHDFEGDV